MLEGFQNFFVERVLRDVAEVVAAHPQVLREKLEEVLAAIACHLIS